MTRARNTADELSLITAKGDLLAGSASGVQSKLTVGSNNTVLTADSATTTGLKWAAISSPTYTWASFTPTFTQGASTMTLSSNLSRYVEIGEVVFMWVNVTFSNTGSANGLLYFTWTTAPSANTNNVVSGPVNIYDASAATRFNGFAEMQGSYCYFQSGVNVANASVNWSQTGSQFTAALGSGDTLWATITYRKA